MDLTELDKCLSGVDVAFDLSNTINRLLDKSLLLETVFVHLE